MILHHTIEKNMPDFLSSDATPKHKLCSNRTMYLVHRWASLTSLNIHGLHTSNYLGKELYLLLLLME